MSSRNTGAPRGLAIVLALAGCGVLVGCASEDPDGIAAPLVVTSHCTIDGSGALASGETAAGGVRDEGGTFGGSWTDVVPGLGTLEVAAVSSLECRLNGATVGEFAGTGSWNGAPGYDYRVVIQDRGAPGEPTRELGPHEVDTLEATRRYWPTRVEDGELTFDHGARVTVPSALDVTVGNAGNGYAWMTFVLDHTGEPIRCVYQGGASRIVPHRPADVAAGRTYELVACERLAAAPPDDDGGDRCSCRGRRVGHERGRGRGHEIGRGRGHACDHDHDGGSGGSGMVWTVDPALAAGSPLDVTSVELHVESGSYLHPHGRAPRTTVSVDLDVWPYVPGAPRPDAYRVSIWDPSGTLVHTADGDLATGDFTIALLP